MPLDIKSLVRTCSIPVNNQGRFHRYDYATPDAAATVLAAGYFNGARDLLKVNDRIDVMAVWHPTNNTGDILETRVTAVPATGDVTVAVNTEAAGA